MADSHADGAVDEEGAAAGSVDEEENDAGEDDEESVLYAGTDEVDVASQARHLEDVDDVVGHDIGAGHLLPLRGISCMYKTQGWRQLTAWTDIPASVRRHMPR